VELGLLWLAPGEQGVELSQDSDGEERGESWKEGGDLIPGMMGSLRDCSDLLADSMPALAICCISALARLLDNLRKSDVFLRLSTSLFLCRCLATFLRAILMEAGSRRRPPVLIEVVSRAVALKVTASPPDMSSWRTWVW